MKESMPSMPQPPQAAQKLRFWLGVRGTLVREAGVTSEAVLTGLSFPIL
jgi:hypothetical protein